MLQKYYNFFIDQLFPKYTFISYGAFRLIRDSDIEFSDEAEDLVTTFENQLRKRRVWKRSSFGNDEVNSRGFKKYDHQFTWY